MTLAAEERVRFGHNLFFRGAIFRVSMWNHTQLQKTSNSKSAERSKEKEIVRMNEAGPEGQWSHRCRNVSGSGIPSHADREKTFISYSGFKWCMLRSQCSRFSSDSITKREWENITQAWWHPATQNSLPLHRQQTWVKLLLMLSLVCF